MSATLTVHFAIDGWPVALALEAGSGNEVLKMWPQVRDGLTGLGAKPTTASMPQPVDQVPGDNGNGGPAKMGQAGNGLPMRYLPDGSPDPAWCPVHACEMKRRTKDGQVWYSHKVDGVWCRGTWNDVK